MELQSVDTPGNEERDAIQLNDIEKALQEFIGDQFPILDLPNEILYKLYPYLDHLTRNVLSHIKKMEEIRKKVEIRCDELTIEIKDAEEESEDAIISLNGVKRTINIDKLDNEIEQIGINRHFDKVVFGNKYSTGDELARSALKYIKAKELDIYKIKNEVEFESIIQNKESICFAFMTSSHLNYMWFYKRMVALTPESELKKVRINHFWNDNRRQFFEELDIEEYWDPFDNPVEYIPTSPKQIALTESGPSGDIIAVYERHLKIEIGETEGVELDDECPGCYSTYDQAGWITFTINEASYNGRVEEEQSKLLTVQVEDSGVRLKLDAEAEREIPFDEVDSEMEKIGNNRIFEKVVFKSNDSDDRRPITALKHLHATEFDIDDAQLIDPECEGIFENKESVNLTKGNYTTCKWFYEKLSAPDLDCSEIVSVKISSLRNSQREEFLNYLGIDHTNTDIDGRSIYKATKDELEVHPIEGGVTITEGHLKIVVHDCEICDGEGIDQSGWVSFEICDSDEESDDDYEYDSDEESDENTVQVTWLSGDDY